MGRISDEDVQRVRDATDVVALISERVVLRQKGRLWWGLCPFHGEKTPSFKVDPSTQLWHCFGCGKGGDVFGFVIETDRVEFPEAVRLLAERARIEIAEEAGGVGRGKKDRLLAVLDATADYYCRVLTGSRDREPAQAREYLAGRGMGSEVAKRWRLGYAPGRGALVRHLSAEGFSADEMVEANVALRSDGATLKDRFYGRVMFPIADLQGRVIAFGGRILGKGEPKYLNTNDTPVFRKSANMYAIDRAKATITSSGLAIVTEGYTDVIALHEAGITNAVATLGTALTEQHVKLLGRFAKKIVYLFDGDEAGMRAADRASEFVDAYATEIHRQFRVDLSAAVIPDGLDPADLVAAKGADALREVIEGADPLLRFAIDRRLARWDLERPEERSRALKEATEVLAPVKESILAEDYANYIADRLLVDFSVVKTALDAVRANPRHARPEAEDEKSERAEALAEPDSPRARAERELIALLVKEPALRARARELLTTGLLSIAEHRAMADVICGHAAQSVEELTGLLESRVPGAAAELSGTSFADESENPAHLADGLTARLKEFELSRRIAVGKAKLKSPESFKSPEEYDELFGEVSALQRELDALRRGESMSNDGLKR